MAITVSADQPADDPRRPTAPHAGAGPGTCRFCGEETFTASRSHKECRRSWPVPENLRRIVLEQADGRCAGCGQQKPDRELEAAHVHPVADGGRLGAEHCRALCISPDKKSGCHVEETRRENRDREKARRRRARKARRHTKRGTGPMSLPDPAMIAEAMPRPPRALVLSWAGALAVTAALWTDTLARALGPDARAARAWLTLALAGACALALAVWARRVARAMREYALARLLKGLSNCNVPGAQLAARGRVARLADLVRARGLSGLTWPEPTWTRGRPNFFRLAYDPVARDDDPAWRETVRTRLERRLGYALAEDPHPEDDYIDYARTERRVEQSDRPEDPSTPERKRAQISARATQAIRAHLKDGDARVHLTDWDAVGPRAVEVELPASFGDHSDTKRADLMGVIDARVPGRRKYEWDTVAGWLRGQRRPSLPDRITHPGTVSPNKRLSPLGMAETHEEAAIDWGTTNNALISGETGAGKSVAIRLLVADRAAQGWEIYLCDRKRIGIGGMRGWPGVVQCATDIDGIAVTIAAVKKLMDARYAHADENPGAEADYEGVLLVVDEGKETLKELDKRWGATGNRGREHPAAADLRSVVSLGREVHVHVVLGSQRPDASWVGGDTRESFGARVAFGSLDPEGARMMFADGTIGRDVPDAIKGRGTADLGAGPVEVQSYWMPDPRKVGTPECTPEDEELLRRLRELAAKVHGDRAADRAADREAYHAARDRERRSEVPASSLTGGELIVVEIDGADTVGKVADIAEEDDASLRVTVITGEGERDVVLDSSERVRLADQ